MKNLADKIAEPFTENIDEYLAWLQHRIGSFADVDPWWLAGKSVELYRWYQRSPEHREAHNLPPLDNG